jgi:peptide deformylase
MSQLSIFYPLVTDQDSPILREKSQTIHHFDAEVEGFADILLALMYEYDGVGLAAPQLGENICMIAVTQRKETKTAKGKTGKKS